MVLQSTLNLEGAPDPLNGQEIWKALPKKSVKVRRSPVKPQNVYTLSAGTSFNVASRWQCSMHAQTPKAKEGAI